MNGLALCAGIGGLEIGLKRAVPNYRTVCYVERNPYAAGVLAARMEEEALCKAPIWDDLTTFESQAWCGLIDIITAGFPCQPFSTAGERRGLADERWIWPAIAGIIGEIKPSFVFLENVPGFVSLGLKSILRDLAEMGFDAKWCCVTAESCGAPHERERFFLVANSASWRSGRHPGWKASGQSEPGDRSQNLADTYSERLSNATGRAARPECGRLGTSSGPSWWNAEPDVGGTSHGISRRLDGAITDEKDERIGEVLRYLQQDHVAQALQWATRRLDCVQATEVLLAILREYEGGGRLRWALLESEATPETILRKMREQKAPLCPPLRSGTLEQYFREHPNALRIVSRMVASRGETPWSNPLWEGSVSRVAEGIPSRVDRLKCLGNAVVPAQAELAWRILTS